MSRCRIPAEGFRFAKKTDHFAVRCLLEILKIRADRQERIGRGEADHFVGIVADDIQRLGRSDRNRQDNAGCLILPQGFERDPCRSSGGYAVVNQDDRPAGDGDGPPVSEIKPSPALDLGKLAVLFSLDVTGVGPDDRQDFLVQDELRVRTVDDRADTVFLMSRRTDLAHQQNIERRMEGLCHLEGDGNTTARQSENKRSGSRKPAQSLRELVSGVLPILESRSAPEHCGYPSRCLRNHTLMPGQALLSGTIISMTGTHPALGEKRPDMGSGAVHR